MKTLVINNREGLEQFQMQPLGKDSSGTKILGRVVTLIPGLNLVPSADLAEVRKNPLVEARFSTEIKASPAPEQSPEKVGKTILEIVKLTGKDGKVFSEVDDELPLAKLTAEQCKRLISETLVSDTLKGWVKQETRPEIRWEIEKQLESLSGKPANVATAGR